MASTPPKGQIYDSVAGAYDVVWSVPAVKILFPVLHTTLTELGPWTGKAVLDLACGTGIGLREMRKLGAARLVGVDISAQMLEVAKLSSSDFELHHADCSAPLSHLPGLGDEGGRGIFDLVLGFWLLNYAADRAQMRGMWANVARYLRPRGHFVGIIQNQDVVHPTSMQGKWTEYGAQESDLRELESGDGVRMHVEFETVPKVEFDTFVLRREILEEEAQAAGMRDLRYLRPGEEVKGEVEGKSEEWWRELLEAYPNQIIVAQKA